jgi:two-component system, LytTR family, sensor kinase
MGTASRKAPKIVVLYFWSAFIWLAFSPVMAGQEKVRLLERGLYTAYWKLLLVNGAWCLTSALLTPPMFSVVRRYPIAKPVGLRRIAGYVLGSIPWVIASVCIRWILLPPWDSVTQQFTPRSLHALIGNTYLFANQIWDYLVVVVAAHAYEYFMRARNQELERVELQQALAVSELQALKSQLQPHFLFNTLQGISTLVEIDKARAKAIILKLSRLLRTVLQRGDSDLVTVDEELKLAEAYLDIEKMRLNGRLDVRWKTQPGTGHQLVPQLILQPLIENAIVHGIACSREGGWLEIGLRRLHDRIELCLRNSVRGKGESGLGLGLQNTKARLKYLYADEATLSFALDNEGVATATVLLPALEGSQADLGNEAADAQCRSK